MRFTFALKEQRNKFLVLSRLALPLVAEQGILGRLKILELCFCISRAIETRNMFVILMRTKFGRGILGRRGRQFKVDV